MCKKLKEAVNSAIHFAYYIGDKDECFYKHVGHTLASVYIGNGFKNVVDYKTPDCSQADQMTELYDYWEKVEKLTEGVSKEQFRKMASSNKYAEYFNDYYIELALEHGLDSGTVTITKDNIHLYYEFMGGVDLEKYKEILNNIFISRFNKFCNIVIDETFLINGDFNISKFYIAKLSKKHNYLLGFSFFEVKDTLKPIEEYIAEVKSSKKYKAYMA